MLLWVAASLVLAAGLAPWLYQGGKGFAQLAREQDFAGLAGWLGYACRRADFGRYFNRGLLLAALLLLPFLFRRLSKLRQAGAHLLPPGDAVSWPAGMVQYLIGLLLAGGVVWGLGMVLDGLGEFTSKPLLPGAKRVLIGVLIPAVMVSVVEEWLFRGLLLGLWLRVARPRAACLGVSLVFALLHFLAPPPGVGMAEPFSAVAGFRQLGGILLQVVEPRFFAANFLTLFAVGMILAWVRLRTGRLWCSMGLHCGWVIAFKAYNLTHLKASDGPLNSWWIGDDLRSGLLPLAALVLTAWLSHLLLKTTGYQAKVRPA